MNDSISSVGKSTRWKKGTSGNPGGRPKSALVSEALRKQLVQLKPGDKQARTYAEMIAANMIEIASEADGSEAVHAAGMICDRIEGRVKQQLEFNDITADIRRRSDAELLFHLDNGRWPTPEELAELNERAGLSDMDGGTTKIQ